MAVTLIVLVLACSTTSAGPVAGDEPRGSISTNAEPFIYLPLVLTSQASPQLAGCTVFPADNVWNTPVDTLPVDANSDAYVATIGANTNIHPDFGTFWDNSPIGIPYVDVPGNQPMVPISFDYDDESDPGPYPIPPDAPIEGGVAGHKPGAAVGKPALAPSLI
jgi:hypothetical protein